MAAGATNIGMQGMFKATETLSFSAIDLFKNPQLIKKAKKEFNTRRARHFKYTPLLGNRKSPLDYRN